MPSIPQVKGLGAVTINSTAVVVKWTPIPEDYDVGGLLGYRITLYRYVYTNLVIDRPRMTTRKTSFSLTDLQPVTFFFIHVGGYTNNSHGPNGYLIFTTRKFYENFGSRFGNMCFQSKCVYRDTVNTK